MRFFAYGKSPSWSDLFLNPLTLTSPVRVIFFSPETEFSLPVLSFFSRHLPAPFCSDGEGEVDFFVISKTRFWPQTGRNVSAARARAYAAAVTHFCEICAGGMARFRLCARAIKTDRLKGIRLKKNGKSPFWVISGSLFSPKKFYSLKVFSVVLDDLIFPFCQIVVGPVTDG